MPGSSLGKCNSKRFLSLMYTSQYIVHKVVVGMTNGSGEGRLRGIGTYRKRVRKDRKIVERKLGGRKGNIYFLFSRPPLQKKSKPCPIFFNHTP